MSEMDISPPRQEFNLPVDAYDAVASMSAPLSKKDDFIENAARPAITEKDERNKERSRSQSKDHSSTGRERDRDKDKDRSSSRRKRDVSKERDRSRDKDRDRERDKDRSDKDRGKDRDRDIERSRDKDRGDRDRERSRDKDRGDRDRERSRDKDRTRDRRERSNRNSRERSVRDNRDSRNSKTRSNYDDYRNRQRSKSRDRRRNRDRGRERSRSYERRRSRSKSYDREKSHRRRDRERERDRNSRERNSRERSSRDRSSRDRNSRERSRRSNSREDRYQHLPSIREEIRDNRFDLTQTIQELMSSTANAKNFAALFNCQNSNDSFTNGLSENSQDAADRKRRKKSRWGGTENDKTFIPGMPTILPSTLDPTQQEAYLVQLQIEEISRKLRTGELGIPQNPEERSPSPEPIYSSDGKRLNTREFRYRKKLEEQRHQLIQKMQSVNPEFKPPADYKPPVTRVIDKVLIPQEEHPDINFVGLLIGPRGNTLKAMEKETSAKIIIRGKGSVKEGKVGRKDGQPLAGEDEPLHAFITAPNPDSVKKAVEKIKDIIRQGIEVPEGHNDLRRMQLRELAQLNGTLRETDCPRCTNCGSTEHKSWLCPDKPNVMNSIVCTSCGGAGHISKDCRTKRPGAGGVGGVEGEGGDNSQAKIDEEYMSLMAELGEGPPPAAPKPATDVLAQAHINRGYSIFDKKPLALQAIQQAPIAAPPPVTCPPPCAPPPMSQPWNQTAPVGMPPMLPPHASQPPPPPMPWMAAPPLSQPPPPGGDPPPPGTMPPLLPPPPGTGGMPWSPGIPAGVMPPPSFPSWGSGVFPPPPPPPCAPPGLSGLNQPPPPPPPPSN